jgi:deoxyribose-phosphate aldolase
VNNSNTIPDIAQYIDQTILKPEATRDDIHVFLNTVEEHKFKCAVVNPCWVAYARSQLPGSINVCSVVGFPLGASSTQVKISATTDLISRGCDEVDMVMNIGFFLSREYNVVGKEIRDIVDAAQGRMVKVIIETCLLTDMQKQTAAQIVLENGAHFVKTSTGFSISGATVKDVRLLKEVVAPHIGIKASGGIRTYDQAIALIHAGATRLGTSAGPIIVQNQSQSD